MESKGYTHDASGRRRGARARAHMQMHIYIDLDIYILSSDIQKQAQHETAFIDHELETTLKSRTCTDDNATDVREAPHSGRHITTCHRDGQRVCGKQHEQGNDNEIVWRGTTNVRTGERNGGTENSRGMEKIHSSRPWLGDIDGACNGSYFGPLGGPCMPTCDNSGVYVPAAYGSPVWKAKPCCCC
jgi:hypothetical protein